MRARDTMVPFVPFLSLATLITLLYDKEVDKLFEWIING